MADLETLHKYAQSSVAPLKKIIASQGKNRGTFYFVKGKKQGESGVAIFLQKMDKKGAKALASGKALKKASGGNKFSVGTIAMEDSKLCFRVKKGSAGSSVVAKSFKLDFKNDDFKILGNLLKKAKVFDGAAETAEVIEEINPNNAEAPVSEEFSAADLANIEADLVKIQEDLTAMQEELVDDLKGADAEARRELADILNAEDDLASDMIDVQNLYFNLLEEELMESKDMSELTGVDGEDLISIVETIYQSDEYSAEEMKDIARQISSRGVDLSAFENQAAVGNKLPEPLRSQILLSKKIQEEEQNSLDYVSNFPASIQPIWESIQNIIQNQSNAMASALSGQDADFTKIGKYISSGALFNSFPSDIEKTLGKISSSESTKAIQSMQRKLNDFSNHLLTSPKIEACDGFIPAANIRTMLVPKISQLTKIMDRVLQ